MTKFERLYLRLNPAPEGFPVGAIQNLEYHFVGEFVMIAHCNSTHDTMAWALNNEGSHLPAFSNRPIPLILHRGDEAKAAHDEAMRIMLEYETGRRELEQRYFPGSE